MKNWIIIRVLLPNGNYRFDAIPEPPPINTSFDIEYGDGEIIKAGSYIIFTDNLTEQEADEFLAKVNKMAKQDY